MIGLVALAASAYPASADDTGMRFDTGGSAGGRGTANVKLKALDNVGIDQKLDAPMPVDLPFVDEAGNQVTLGSYFGRRPVILVFAYYRCPMLCTLVLNDLGRAINACALEPGKDYDVVTISFDSREDCEAGGGQEAGTTTPRSPSRVSPGRGTS